MYITGNLGSSRLRALWTFKESIHIQIINSVICDPGDTSAHRVIDTVYTSQANENEHSLNLNASLGGMDGRSFLQTVCKMLECEQW